MQDYLYSVIAFLAIVIHLIINFDMFPFHGRKMSHIRCAHEYRGFLASIFYLYITDALWGIFAGLGWTKALYFDTMSFFIATAVSILTMCHFIITYLGTSGWRARILAWFGYVLLSLYVVMLFVNVFNHCLFYFDAEGRYVTGSLRNSMYYPLVAASVLMAINVFVKAFGSQDTMRRRYIVVALFCLTMGGAILLQILWTLWPFYALGCLISNCFIHVFLIEDERFELQQDIIKHEQKMKHMEESEKARSMFFSTVSHDIRTPLNAILGYSELLQDSLKSQAEKDEALKSIRASGTTLLQLVNDVLDLAKMDAGKMTLKPEPLLLGRLVEEVFSSFRMAAKTKGIELVNNAAAVPTVMLDEHRFRQILFNLVGNAVKFTSKGGVRVSATYDGSNLEVSVSDTGCGIAPDILMRVLDPFVQAHDPRHSADRAGGTGLGLSICRRLVELMGGELVVKSELGKGSVFRVCIPGVSSCATKAIVAVEAPKPVAAEGAHPKHVLVVDDSPVNRAVLTAHLKRARVALIDQACDGVEALGKLDSAVKEGCPHDFVFTDYWMPNMNGLEFAEKLRKDPRFSHLPVFAVTADTEFKNEARSNLFDGVLLKPLTYEKLIAAFSENRG